MVYSANIFYNTILQFTPSYFFIFFPVWLLNRTNEEELNENIVNISEITESLEPSAVKFPQLFTEISNKYFPGGVIPNDFEYEIITDSSEKYMVHSYVCDVEKIKIF